FHTLVKETAKTYYFDLHDHFQFGWTDGDELATSILLKPTPPPALIVFNVSSYQYFVSEDPVEYMTKESLSIFLKSITKGEIRAFGGKGIIQRFKRMIFELYSAVHGMFASQPLLSCCLFGLPLGVLSIICYTLCSTDNSVEREEIYKESDDEEEESEIVDENHVASSQVRSGSSENSDHDKND
uniref:Uncharacterized protein n=1 Tax=Romanomermis culicivorax TaxID=13658 RepID=A0A915KBB2_ROMCU